MSARRKGSLPYRLQEIPKGSQARSPPCESACGHGGRVRVHLPRHPTRTASQFQSGMALVLGVAVLPVGVAASASCRWTSSKAVNS